jgi:hypothetical protein
MASTLVKSTVRTVRQMVEKSPTNGGQLKRCNYCKHTIVMAFLFLYLNTNKMMIYLKIIKEL